MSAVWLIAADEWRYWARSRLSVMMLTVMAILMAATATVTALRIHSETHSRAALQQTAEDTFRTQPDRHPHRMVHYGHYVFRTPPPLAIIDPGLEPVTGQSIFLEGHRQNAAMFSGGQSGAMTGPFAQLTPALLLQIFAPLLLIAVGYGAISREREAGALGPLLAQGVSPLALLLGKTLALASVAALLLAPLLASSMVAVSRGESVKTALIFVSSYAAYLAGWCALVIAASALFRQRETTLALLLVFWLAFCLILPRVAANVSAAAAPAQSKIEADFAVLSALRQLGDGHNAADPAFEQLKAKLLAEYGVSAVEDLPVNFRGIVSRQAETDLTLVLNRFADARMQTEIEQASILRGFGFASPAIAIRNASMTVAGTGLEAHHKFLRDSEALRFEFVQGLNTVHAEKLSYADDANRSSDPEAERRTRVSADNWALLDDFRFVPPAPEIRNAAALSSLVQLALWCLACIAFALLSLRSIKP
jgi:ABC-2 type transport system permease protein